MNAEEPSWGTIGYMSDADPKAVAGVVVLRGDEVLLVRPGEMSHHELGVWGVLGGHVDSGETTVEAAVRETYEETGLVVLPGDLIELPRKYTAELARRDGSLELMVWTVDTTAVFSGTLRTTQETTPRWIPLVSLPDVRLQMNVADAIAQALDAFGHGHQRYLVDSEIQFITWGAANYFMLATEDWYYDDEEEPTTTEGYASSLRMAARSAHHTAAVNLSRGNLEYEKDLTNLSIEFARLSECPDEELRRLHLFGEQVDWMDRPDEVREVMRLASKIFAEVAAEYAE